MKKIYLLLIFVGLICLSFTSGIQAQSNTSERQERTTKQSIQGLRVFISPANKDILYITSDLQLTKTIKIFNVLGKQVDYEVLTGRELHIGDLPSGVYILKITEGENKTTVKFIKP